MNKCIAAGLALGLSLLNAQDIQYNKDGQLVMPKNYRDWAFITSGIGMTYPPNTPPETPNFDNLFVNPSSQKYFLQNGTWPDKTIFIIEVRGSETKQSINIGGRFQTKLRGFEVHVKDAAHGGWGFYFFKPEATEAKVFPKTADCYSCHEQNGAVDTTFVQFYPTLIDVAVQKKTFKAVNH